MTYNLRRLLSGMKEAFARKMRRALGANHFREMDELEKTYQECAIEELRIYEDDRARRAGL